MSKFELDKVVRSGIFERMVADGQQVEHRVLSGEELIAALAKKLVEEASEFDPAAGNPLKELADIREVANTLAVLLGSTQEELNDLQSQVRDESGGFTEGILIEAVALADDDPWVEYYRARPDLFPEVEE